jgi:hypothetical protein
MNSQGLESYLLRVLNYAKFDDSPIIEADTALEQILGVNGIYPEVLIEVLEGALPKPIDQGLIQPNESLRMMCGRLTRKVSHSASSN